MVTADIPDTALIRLPDEADFERAGQIDACGSSYMFLYTS
jgi:hypothetical protein